LIEHSVERKRLEGSREGMDHEIIIQGARIKAEHLSIGEGVVFDDRVAISGFHGEPAKRIVIGEHTYIGPDVNIACPVLIVGDFVTIHRRTGIFGEGPCAIGHNSWIGQDCILNSHGDLWVGNNVGIGAANHIWTHAAQGELLEGCQLFHAKPVIIEDDAWVCGGHSTINPGVTMATQTILLPQSLLTRDSEPNAYYGGNPAKRIRKLGPPYKTLSIEKKRLMLEDFLRHFLISYPSLTYTIADGRLSLLKDGVKKVGEFDFIQKRYERQRSPEETAFIIFMRGNKARFIPEDEPVLGEKIRESAQNKIRKIL
jgi:acetyltransferase-like isoleucine patch superfamily enzyme